LVKLGNPLGDLGRGRLRGEKGRLFLWGLLRVPGKGVSWQCDRLFSGMEKKGTPSKGGARESSLRGDDPKKRGRNRLLGKKPSGGPHCRENRAPTPSEEIPGKGVARQDLRAGPEDETLFSS